MNVSKKFSLGQVLAVTCGCFFKCEGDFGMVYDILNFLTQDDLYTHALPRARLEALPCVLEQYPALAEITEASLEGVNNDNCREILTALENKYGSTFELYPMHSEDHEYIDPVVEAERMVGKGKVIPIELPVDDNISPTGDISWRVDE